MGVKKNSTKDEMKNSYYDLLKKYHPDKVDNLADDFKKLAEQKTKELNEAYRILSQ